MIDVLRRNVSAPLSAAVCFLVFSVAGAVAAPSPPGEAIAEMLHVEGWFVSAERDAGGTFSHCQIMTPYFYAENSILLSFTLSHDRRALAVVVDPAVDRITPRIEDDTPEGGGARPRASDPRFAREAVYTFDGGPDLRAPASFTGSLMRLEISDWATFRRHLIGAKRIRIAGPDRDRTFNLYGLDEALPALETCAADRALPKPTPPPKPAGDAAGANGPTDVEAEAETETETMDKQTDSTGGEETAADRPRPPGFKRGK